MSGEDLSWKPHTRSLWNATMHADVMFMSDLGFWPGPTTSLPVPWLMSLKVLVGKRPLENVVELSIPFISTKNRDMWLLLPMPSPKMYRRRRILKPYQGFCLAIVKMYRWRHILIGRTDLNLGTSSEVSVQCLLIRITVGWFAGQILRLGVYVCMGYNCLIFMSTFIIDFCQKLSITFCWKLLYNTFY